MSEYTDIFLFFWEVIDSTVGGDVDPCEASPDWSSDADTVAPDPDFPDSDLGTFTSHSVDGCEYKYGKDNTVGTMTCPGVDSIACQKSEQYNDSWECGGPVMVLVIDCLWV